MNKKIAVQDFKKNKVINLSIFILICLTAFLSSAVLLLSASLLTAIDTLMDKAKTPDFLQMHQGDIDEELLIDFAENNEFVEAYQCLEFVNFEGEKIIINGKSQENAVQDNGVVYQSEKFDFLLDLNNENITVNPGEIYLPLMFYKDKTAQIGDSVKIAGENFIVKGFFRDSQMNSNMAGSKRLLLSKVDFEHVKAAGNPEYLIEYLLKDRKNISDFEKDYQEQIPYKNGPTITYAMFKIINALNDGILIVVLLLGTVMLMMIAMLCIRFIVMAKLEDDFLEIAIMKAIGLSHKNIKYIYLSLYMIIAALASLIAYILSLAFSETLLADIQLYMGKGDASKFAPFIALFAPILTFALITIFINRKLNNIKFIKPVAAIRLGKSGLNKEKRRKFQASKKSINLDRPVFKLALVDLKARHSAYFTIAKLIILATFLSLIPIHLFTTINHKSFVQTMGMGESDISFDIQQVDNIEGKTANVLEELSKDNRVEKLAAYSLKSIEFTLPNTKTAYLKVNIGDHSVFPITYTHGQAPKTEDEIALSALYADDLELKVGDKLQLPFSKESLKIVGIYSDISNGGKTAKAFRNLDGSILKTSILLKISAADVEKDNYMETAKDKWSETYSFAKVSTIQDYIDQAFGPLKNQVKFASIIAFTAAIIVIALVSGLFTKLLVAKDKQEIVNLKAIGFTDNDLRLKYIYALIIVSLLSIILGILIANSLGAYIATALISSFGASAIKLFISPVLTYLLVPLLFVLTIVVVAVGLSREIKKIKITEHIRE